MQPLIVQAAAVGDINAVRKLLHEGCDINERNFEGRTALRMAVEFERVEIAELLIMYGADVNIPTISEGIPPLAAATEMHGDSLIRLLLNNRANLNVQCNLGATALHYAVCFTRYKAVEILLEAKADVNLKTKYGARPIDWARSDDFEMQMLFNKADLEFEIEDSKTDKDSKPESQ